MPFDSTIIICPSTKTAMLSLATYAQFPSVAPLLSSSQLLGVYFASSWCPDCTPVTPRLSLLHAETTTTTFKDESAESANTEKSLLNVVYVSSDTNANQMERCMKGVSFSANAVPFAAVNERTELKRLFGACAGREARDLGMDASGGHAKRFGIPTLIIVDCATGSIVTENGVSDVMNDATTQNGTCFDGVVKGWLTKRSS